LAELRALRRKQVFVYRLGDFIVVGPEPTPQDELVFMLPNEATKRLGSSTTPIRQR
jgi:hypothetical protein